MPKYMRIIVEAEVEVPDSVAVAAEAMNFTTNDDGDLSLIDFPLEENVKQIVAHRFMVMLRDESSSIRPVSCSTRMREASGDMYVEETIPAMPVRLDDGTFADPSWNI